MLTRRLLRQIGQLEQRVECRVATADHEHAFAGVAPGAGCIDDALARMCSTLPSGPGGHAHEVLGKRTSAGRISPVCRPARFLIGTWGPNARSGPMKSSSPIQPRQRTAIAVARLRA